MLPTLAEGHGPLRQGHLERRGLELSRRTNTRLLLQEAEKDRLPQFLYAVSSAGLNIKGDRQGTCLSRGFLKPKGSQLPSFGG